MADLPSPILVTQLAGLLAPGFIIVAMRRKAIAGPLPSLKDEILLYGLASTAYLSVASPIFHTAGGPTFPNWLWSLLLYVMWPLIVGTFLMYEYQREWLAKLCAYMGLDLPHPLPTAWDFRFSGMPETAFLLVTLNDGTQVAGRWAPGSFASSDAGERDLLIAEMWTKNGQQPWTQLAPPRSVLIFGKDIRLIEVF